MLYLNRLLALLVVVLLGGCSDDSESESAEDWPEASLPGVYAGVFPCDDCSGIATTLWLRADGRFFFRQRYPADHDRDAMDAHNLGRWSLIGEDRAIELRGAGPWRTFIRLDRQSLIMRTNSELEHRLTRESTATNFTAAIRMTGTMRMVGDNVLFTECLTGYVVPVSKGGDFAKFRHQNRSAGGRGAPTPVELDGRFVWLSDGALKSMTIEQFVTVKNKEVC